MDSVSKKLEVDEKKLNDIERAKLLDKQKEEQKKNNQD